MNICIVTSTFPSNRDEVIKAPFLAPLIDRLFRAGHRVLVLTQETGGALETVFAGVEVHRFAWRRIEGSLAEMSLRSPRNLLASLSLISAGAKAARRLAASGRVDLFIGLWILPSGLYLYPLRFISKDRVPYFVWALGSDVNKYKRSALGRIILRRIIRGARAVFAVGFDLLSEVERIGGVKCHFLSALRKLPDAVQPGRPPNPVPVFAFVGRHALVKGIDVLVEAARLLKVRGSTRFKVEIASEGELTPLLRDRVQRSGLSYEVTFVGKLSVESLRDFYLSADCVVIPSRAEGFPLVFGEALQMNRPMIVTDVAGMAEIGQRYGVARGIPSEDPEALAQAMMGFIERPFAPDPGGRQKVLELLDFDRSFGTLLGRIAELVPPSAATAVPTRKGAAPS